MVNFAATMQYSLLSLVSFAGAGVALSTGCHYGDNDVGKYCAFADYDSFLNVASLYCYQFQYEFSIPKGSYGLVKIGEVPDGYGGQQIFYGKIEVTAGDDYQVISYDACMNAMKEIGTTCQKQGAVYGGWAATEWGYVYGECVRK